ncbi:MAG TPA: hypothetical protein VLT33_23270 [Labilithrix sp.]|nr:hypothetical protein [Labilithrix sp.]
MSDDELLTDALRALQETTDGSSADAARTRTRILAQAAQRARARRRWGLLVMPLAAALFVSTAWAAATGRLPRWIDLATDHAPPATPREELPAPRPVGSAASPPAEPASPAAAESAAAVAAAAPPAAPSSAITPPSPPQKPVPASTATVTARPASTAIASARAPEPSTEEQSLYATAHEAHFVARDSASALRGWDAYLAAHPDGRFAMEARYNRAICLVRLGRRREAREALAPFAAGTYGGYRKSEASELLDALRAADGDPAGSTRF